MPTRSAAGYSGTPLARKLGIKQSSHVFLDEPPGHYSDLVAPLPPDVTFATALREEIDLVHLFVTSRDVLLSRLIAYRDGLRPDTSIWVSWPKKASGVPTTIKEDTIREIALPLGFVDVKVCAVDAVWSGLKLVVRKELR